MVVLKIDKNILNKINKDFAYCKKIINEDYVVSYFDDDAIQIKIYQNNKGEYKAVFNKKDSLKIAKKYDKNAEEIIIKDTPKKYWINTNTQIGSDEVGVGDVLYPLIVVASYIKKEDIDYLKKIGIDDSKKLSDDKIRNIAPLLIKKFKFCKYTIENEKFNKLLKEGYNNNSIKAKYHNYALYLLENKYHTNNCYIDQFVSKERYFKYLENEKVVLNDINFKTQGESYYPSIALSSVIARYYLLLYKDKLFKKYHLDFPFGASKKVDNFIKEFILKYGKDELIKISKNNFSNIKIYLSDDNI